MQFTNKNDIQSQTKAIFKEKAVTKSKSKSRQVCYPRKLIPRKLQILAIFGDSRKYYSLENSLPYSNRTYRTNKH